MNITMYQIDAFTDHVFGGNPAAVCPLDAWISDELMQNIAMENNLSETAFFVKSKDGFEIRWFTPTAEIELAGHPTLATAFVIFNFCNYQGDSIKFSSKGGDLFVAREGDLLKMNFPSTPPVKAPKNSLLERALSRKPAELYYTRDYLAVYKTEEEILAISPDFNLLKKLDRLTTIVTAPGKSVDFVSRVFAPSVGINEDPVTGSAHVTLIPYWAGRLKKDTLHAYQVSSRRGEIFCKDLGSRVEISGRAVHYLTGSITV